MSDEPTFSVILPVYHGGVLLCRSLAALMILDYPPERFEVLVPVYRHGPGGLPSRGTHKPEAARPWALSNARSDADQAPRTDEPSPDPQRIVETFAATVPFRVAFVASAATTRAGALNAALARARGRLLAFADDDVFVESGWLTNLEAAFAAHPQAGPIGGVDVLTDDVGPFDLAFDAVLHSLLGSGRIREGAGVRVGQDYPRLWNMALPREAALAAARPGPDGSPQIFNAALATHEDVELGERVRRLGRPLVFAPEVRVRHRRETTFGSVLRRDFDAARNARAEGLHRWPHRILAGGLVGLIALSAGAVCWPPLRVALAAVLATYGTALAFVAIDAFVQKRKVAVALLAPIVAAGLHLVRAAGYLVGRQK